MAEGKYERIDRKIVRTGRVITDCIDTVSLPDGRQAPWDCIVTKGAAAVVAVEETGKLLLVRQWRDPEEEETLELPSGSRLTAEEPTEVTAARELREETGYRAGSLRKLLSVRTTPAFSNERIDIYLAERLVPGAQHLDPDEELLVERVTPERAREMIFDGSIQDGKTIAGILAYLEMKR
ncbi:MAG: NUDIX hydrolase [Firmicutes bacterium]|nr:NUDIX hydrolase [Bacillota bacterium]